MLKRTGWLLLLWACAGKDPVTPPPGGGGGGDDDDDITPPVLDTDTPPVPPERPSFECFGQVAFDDGRDGVIDGDGYDGYDPDHPNWLMYSDRDANGNGLLEYVDVFERDADGNATRTVRERAGAQTLVSTWDARGNLLTNEYDTGSDGLIDALHTYVWDPNDQLLHYEVDFGDDGNLDYELDYERTPEGFRISRAEDADGDGDIDMLNLYTLDAADRSATITYDELGDGVVEGLLTYTYTDPVLLIGGYSYDVGQDGVAEEVGAFEYDENGLELYFAFDTTPDGEWNQEEFTTRDAEGRVLTNLYRVGGFDPLEVEYTYAYDALGRTVQSTYRYAYDSGSVLADEQTDTTFGGSCP